MPRKSLFLSPIGRRNGGLYYDRILYRPLPNPLPQAGEGTYVQEEGTILLTEGAYPIIFDDNA